MKTLLALAILFLGTSAQADTPVRHGLGHWRGTGVRYDQHHKELGTYTVSLDRNATSDGVLVIGTVSLASGQTYEIHQNLIGDDKSFKLESNRGTGGGYCFDGGLCQIYEQTDGGNAYATTVAIDGEDQMRSLTTELAQGKAVSFSRQTLTRSK